MSNMLSLYQTLCGRETIGCLDVKKDDIIAVLTESGADIMTVGDVGLARLLVSANPHERTLVAVAEPTYISVHIMPEGGVSLLPLMPANGENSRLPYWNGNRKEELGPLANYEMAYWTGIEDRRLVRVTPEEIEQLLLYAQPRPE